MRRFFVIKFGSSTLLNRAGGYDEAFLESIGRQLVAVQKSGFSPVIVASGAVALGRHSVAERGRGLQRTAPVPVLAAIGQCECIVAFSESFRQHGLLGGQILLTADDFGHPDHVQHVRSLVEEAASIGVIPILNENDVTTWGKRSILGENDRLAALVAMTIRADLLALLSNVPGVLKPSSGAGDVTEVFEQLEPLQLSTSVKRHPQVSSGRGGIAAKLDAARMAAFAGIDTVIANGRHPDILPSLISGKTFGTRVCGLDEADRFPQRRIWAAFRSEPEGAVLIDDGALRAVESGGSLLPVGIQRVIGEFSAGAVVSILSSTSEEIGRGRCDQSAASLREIVGLRRRDAQRVLSARPDVRRGSSGEARMVSIHRDYALMFRGGAR